MESNDINQDESDNDGIILAFGKDRCFPKICYIDIFTLCPINIYAVLLLCQLL